MDYKKPCKQALKLIEDEELKHLYEDIYYTNSKKTNYKHTCDLTDLRRLGDIIENPNSENNHLWCNGCGDELEMKQTTLVRLHSKNVAL